MILSIYFITNAFKTS